MNNRAPILAIGAERRFYVWAALAIALVALTGFARSYYLKYLFGRPPLSPLIHVHGIVMTLWILLFFIQTRLVAVHRVDLHRLLGVLGAGWAVLVVILGTYATILGVEREVLRHHIGPFHFLLGINLVNLFVFATLIGVALVYRRRPEFHKRLMLLAAVSLLAPAAARIALLFTHRPVVQLVAFYVCVLFPVLLDTARHRRLHPAFGWGAALIIACFQAIFYTVQTRQWMSFVAFMFPSS
jgi:hypothetical protein